MTLRKIAERVEQYLSQCAPHVKEREAAKLLAECLPALRDAERLDWLLSKCAINTTSHAVNCEFPYVTGKHGQTTREAIDAAIAKERT